MPLRSLFVDMNSYFASCEQHLRPELRGRPIVVAPVDTDFTSCIAASREAKPFGISTGTPVWQARQLCPKLLVVHARPPKYLELHHQILAVVESHIHVDAVLSIDEVACRLPINESSPERALNIALQIKKSLAKELSPTLSCSIGLAPNRFLAKVATDMQKPNGLIVIRSEDLPHKLFPLQLRDLPGVGHNMHVRLAAQGVQTVEQLCQRSADDLAKIWNGITGRQFWQDLHGHDSTPAPTERRTLGHSHVLAPELRNDAGAKAVLVRLVQKAMARLCHMHYFTRRLSLSIQFADHTHWSDWASIAYSQDTLFMLEVVDKLWSHRPPGNPKKVGITLSDLEPEKNVSAPLFALDQQRLRLNKAINHINFEFGSKTLYLATMHHARQHAPMRIAFTVVPDRDW